MAHAAILIGSILVAWALLRLLSIERELRISALREQIEAEARAEHEEQMRAAEARKLAGLRAEEKPREEAAAAGAVTQTDPAATAESGGRPA